MTREPKRYTTEENKKHSGDNEDPTDITEQ